MSGGAGLIDPKPAVFTTTHVASPVHLTTVPRNGNPTPLVFAVGDAEAWRLHPAQCPKWEVVRLVFAYFLASHGLRLRKVAWARHCVPDPFRYTLTS